MSTPDPHANIPPARRERSAAPSPPVATVKYLAMARVRQAETARCQQNSQEKQDYLVHLPTNILTQIVTNMYEGRVMLVRRTAEKLLSQTEFAKHERCQLLLTCKPLYFAAKPIMYSQVEFAFTTPESFDRFFNVETTAGAERCLLTRHVVCENVQLHPFLYGKENLLGVNAQDEDVVVILDDIDECYEADCEDNDQSEDMETTDSNVKHYGDASGSFPYFDSGD